MKCFDESMEKRETEAKQNISNYINNKVTSLGIESLKNEFTLVDNPVIKSDKRIE